jgi:hypothetical protein
MKIKKIQRKNLATTLPFFEDMEVGDVYVGKLEAVGYDNLSRDGKEIKCPRFTFRRYGGPLAANVEATDFKSELFSVEPTVMYCEPWTKHQLDTSRDIGNLIIVKMVRKTLKDGSQTVVNHISFEPYSLED